MTLGGGSWNTFNVRLYQQDRKGYLNYLFGTSYEQSDFAVAVNPVAGTIILLFVVTVAYIK